MNAGSEPERLSPHELCLWRTCISSLPRFYLPEAGILARRVAWSGQELHATAEPSPRNTAEVAKALYRLRSAHYSPPLDPDALMDGIVDRYLMELEYPDVALALWADAVGTGRYFSILWKTLLTRLHAGASETMELSWTLSALCNCAKLSSASNVAALAHGVAKRIACNQGPTGFFYGSAHRKGWLRRRAVRTSLSSQTYAIHALSAYGRIFDVPEALRSARRCADAFCGLQGPLGQWWWIYDVAEGIVLDSYPVYSVNQDAAVPLAFSELEPKLDSKYNLAASRGLLWLFGENELATSLVDEQLGVIWHGIEKKKEGFNIVREMYSYHPGRCLYMLCSRAFSDNALT